MSNHTLLVGILIIPLLCIFYVFSLTSPLLPQINVLPFYPAPRPPLTGPLQENEKLVGVAQIAKGQLDGPESVVIDEHGDLYAGCADGYIYKITTNNLSDDLQKYKAEKWLYVGGRPLGLKMHPKTGNLLIAEPLKGLIHVDVRTKIISILSLVSDDHVPIRSANALAVAKSGEKIYFSDSTVIGPIQDITRGRWITLVPSVATILSSDPTGRLLEYDVTSRTTRVLMTGVVYANGLALSHDESYILMSETGKARIWKYHLTTPNKVGTYEVFADNLPGYPDGLSTSADGGFYAALYSKRTKILDGVMPYPFLKKLTIVAMRFVNVVPPPIGFVVKFNAAGNITESFYDTKGVAVATISDVEEHDGKLYIGSLTNSWISVLKL